MRTASTKSEGTPGVADQRLVRRLLPGIAIKRERQETYDREEIAYCKCGEQINIVHGSDRTCNTDKTRLRYPEDTEGLCVFRCRKCGEVANPQPAKSPVSSTRLLGRMSERQKALLNECCKYSISVIGHGYLRLGGYGYAPIRYHYETLCNMEKAGLVEYIGYWKATQKGQDLMRPNDGAEACAPKPTDNPKG